MDILGFNQYQKGVGVMSYWSESLIIKHLQVFFIDLLKLVLLFAPKDYCKNLKKIFGGGNP